VAWFHPHPGYLNNQIFELDQHRDDSNYPWYCLRQYLAERDIDLQTYDVFEREDRQPHLYFFLTLFRQTLGYIFSRKIKRNQRLLLAWETKLSHRHLPIYNLMWLFLKVWPRFFPVVLTYDRQLIDGQQFRQIFYPQPFFDTHQELWKQEKKRFATMIVSNKQSRTPGENYSTRRKVIRYFEQHHPDLFDLYGVGWHQPQNRGHKISSGTDFRTSVYRGCVDSKLETAANYQFSFCLENYCYPDYITEKIFDALFVGSVPVYFGAQNVLDYIPSSCFIDWRDYKTLDHLFQDLVKIAGSKRLEKMREAGWSFLNSPDFFLFSVDNFCQVVHEAIVDLANRNIQ